MQSLFSLLLSFFAVFALNHPVRSLQIIHAESMCLLIML